MQGSGFEGSEFWGQGFDHVQALPELERPETRRLEMLCYAEQCRALARHLGGGGRGLKGEGTVDYGPFIKSQLSPTQLT